MASYPAYGGSRASDEYPYPPSTNYNANTSTSAFKTSEDDRRISRTPSPTPSEAEELSRPSIFDWNTYRNWRFWIRKEWAWYYVILVIILVLTALISIYHTQIVHWLTPAANWMHGLRFGWLIPIAILFVLSFPPLFGHEIVAILCGVVWGLWIGFAIVAAGTFFGELGNFYAFKYCCRARGEKLEKTRIPYACLAKVVREGGFKIALIARLSAVPGHFTTAVFSTCGMGVITFSIAAILSSPKQFITVYLGVILEQSGDSSTNTKNRVISDAVLAVTFLITVAAMWYLLREMNKVKVAVIYDRRKARQAKLFRANFTPYNNPNAYESGSTVAFNPHSSDTEIPLNPSSDMPYGGSPYQQWNKDGRAVGYAGDPRLYAPKPQHASSSQSPIRIPTFRTEGGGGYDSTGARYGHDDDAPGVVYPVHQGGRSPVRQESSDSVGWDMQHQASHSDELPRVSSPPGIAPPTAANPFSSVETLHQVNYSTPAQSSPVPPPLNLHQQHPISAQVSQPSATPTQTQYISMQQPAATSDITSPPLPTPPFAANFSSPSATPTQAYHPQSYYTNVVEPTDVSYRPADSASMENTSFPPPPRAFSPPPPSYRTSVPER